VQARARSRTKHASTPRLRREIPKTSWRISVRISRNRSRSKQLCKRKWRATGVNASGNGATSRCKQSRQLPANVLPVAPMALVTHPKPFKMRNPAPFCGGADDLDRFLTHVKRLFKSHPQQFPRGEPDQVEYAIDFLGSWKENVDEGLRKTQMTHPNQWASELIKAESECLDDWDLFETEIREMYGDPDW
jgi:hypothetical protein